MDGPAIALLTDKFGQLLGRHPELLKSVQSSRLDEFDKRFNPAESACMALGVLAIMVDADPSMLEREFAL